MSSNSLVVTHRRLRLKRAKSFNQRKRSAKKLRRAGMASFIHSLDIKEAMAAEEEVREFIPETS
jgi:hypothetical protein